MPIVDAHALHPVGGDPAGDEGWTLRFNATAANRRAIESLTSMSDGRFGTRGLLQFSPDVPITATMAAGIYDDQAVPALLPGPAWTRVRIDVDDFTEVAELDLFRGLVTTEITGPTVTARSVQFASIARPGIHGLQVTGPIGAVEAGPALVQSADTSATVERPASDTIAVSSDRGAMVASGSQTVHDNDGERTIARIAAFAAGTGIGDRDRLLAAARSLAATGTRLGLSELLAEHQAAWADRWHPIVLELPADPELQIALRFAQFHLLSASHGGREAAIGARCLPGPAYRGHVFWDADIFVVPALAAMAPPLARAALRYRWHRLGAARRRAASEGFAGARFPWESADSGLEAAPTEGHDLRGKTVPIRTGQEEEHIVADVAWAFSTYLDWTADTSFLHRAGAQVLIATARYWQSRVERDSDGTAHIRGVIGPDEYHEGVDDNAFTNSMAAWNLRRVADLCEDTELTSPAEWHSWRNTAAHLVTGYRQDRGVHEQHAGFFSLEPVMADSLGHPPVSADALLGRDRLQQVQIIKQPDVLMLHHLIPHHLPPTSLTADLDYYLPRTAHGSSLSPAITASVLARADRTTEALRFFEMAARFDLDDLSGTTAGGLHIATMGGLWQAFTQGFLGIQPIDRALTIDPKIPEQWGTVTHRFHFRSAQVRVEASADVVTVTSTAPIDVTIAGEHHRCDPTLVALKEAEGWKPR